MQITDQSFPVIDFNRQPLYVLQTLWQLETNEIEVMSRLFDKYGDNFSLKSGRVPTIFSRDPRFIRDVLVTRSSDMRKDTKPGELTHGLTHFLGDGLLTSDGAHWKKQRQLMSPVFHARAIENFASIMVEHTLRQTETWQAGSTRDIAVDMSQLTLGIVSSALFSSDLKHWNDEISQVLSVIQNQAIQQSVLPDWLPTPRNRAIRQAVQTQDRLIYDLIAERRTSTQQHDDLLQMMLDMQYDDGSRMNDRQLRDEISTLILAGHETTANTLNWTWMLLSQNPDVRTRLQHEVDTVLQGQTPTLAHLSQLKLNEWVIRESMRLYPAVWTVTRSAVRDTEIADVAVEQGTSIMLLFYHLHRHPGYWSDPLTFDPERFERGEPSERYAYLPFSGGPRVCIGNSFAMMEAQLILATVVQRWQLDLPDGHRVTPSARATMYPKDGLPMMVSRR